MTSRYATMLLLLGATVAQAQNYCAPSFANGCFLWRNLSVNVGSINWASDGNCESSDHTALSATINAGATVPMTVSSGNWTGCAVWVDLNNDEVFEEEENLFYSYVGGDPSYTYQFSITIPPGTPTGSYRMRVVAAWGSDGFLDTNTNGYGPCGNFQYGNYDDFTLNVDASTSSGAQLGEMATLQAVPNPTGGVILLHGASSLQHITIYSADGRLIQQLGGNSKLGNGLVDLSNLPAGAYLLHCTSAQGSHVLRVMKQ